MKHTFLGLYYRREKLEKRSDFLSCTQTSDGGYKSMVLKLQREAGGQRKCR